jgi:hypothetical protein
MNLFRGLAGLLIADLILLGYLLGRAAVLGEGAILASYVGYLIVGAGILVALISLVRTSGRDDSADFLESARELLEHSYKTLAVLDEHERPKNIRIRWLAAARFLRASEKMGESITEDSHKAIYREHKEYWRAQFYDLIYPNSDGFPSEYYAKIPKDMLYHGRDDKPPLSERSLAVLYRFIRWPEGFADPLENDTNFSDDEIHKMQTFGPRGLGNLLAEVRALKEKRDEPKVF